MNTAPIPKRIPPLTWRKPALVCTPAALAASVLWPQLFLNDDPALSRLTLLGLVATFALTLIVLAVAWAMLRPPRSRRLVALYAVLAGAAVSLFGPFVANAIVAGPGGLAPITVSPLVTVMGLPVVLASALLFAWIALKPADNADDDGTLDDDAFGYRGDDPAAKDRA